MLGYPLKLLLEVVEAEGGAEALAEVKRRAGVSPHRTYRMNESCADEESQRLFAAADEVLALGGERSFELLAETFVRDTRRRFPVWYQMCASSREFLEHQPEIHNCFAAGLQDPNASKAIVDKFRLERLENELIVHYCSPNRLCMLYRALAYRVIEYYGDEASVEERRCLHQGDTECEIHIRWI